MHPRDLGTLNPDNALQSPLVISCSDEPALIVAKLRQALMQCPGISDSCTHYAPQGLRTLTMPRRRPW